MVSFFYRRENGYVTEVVTLMKGEWSCYRGDHFNEGRMVILQMWPEWSWEWSCYQGHFNGRKNGHVTEVVTLMEGEWSCYRGGHFKRWRMMLQR